MLTEQQIADLKPRWSDYPERRVVVPTYPPPRKRRPTQGGGTDAQDDEGLQVLPPGGITGAPHVSLWSLNLYHNVAGTGLRRGSPRFLGPALIHSFHGVFMSRATGGILYPTQVSYAPAPYADSDTLGAFVKLAGTPIAVNADPYQGGAANSASGDGFINASLAAANELPIGVYVTLPEFYIGVSIYVPTAAQVTFDGFFRVIEHAPPESISWT